MMSTTTEMQNACCFAHHSPGPSTNLKTNSQPHIRPQTAVFFSKIGLAYRKKCAGISPARSARALHAHTHCCWGYVT